MKKCILAALGLGAGARAGRTKKLRSSMVKSLRRETSRTPLRTRFAKQQVTAEQAKLYRRQVLKWLVDDLLINQFLDQEKIVADEEKVEKHIQQLRQQLQASGRLLEQFLEENRVDEERMKNDIRNIYRWLSYVESQATDATIRKYFEANKAAFDGSEVRASHILVKTTAGMNEAQRQSARRKIESILLQLAGGVSFAEAAKCIRIVHRKNRAAI